MRCDIVSIFPEYLEPLALSLPGQAQRKGLLEVVVHDLRDFAHDRHRTVDDTPYGGGAGMVMKAQPWWEALDHVRGQREGTPTLIVPGPGGEVLTQALARELSQQDWLVFACGRYEGIDERVYEAAADVMPVRVISLGDYVLNGGEVAVLAMIEAAARLLPGFMGNAESLVEESHEDGLLEYPVYTKPASWQGRDVPPVLLSGDHGKVAQWRHRQRVERTAARRPDLLHASALVNGDEIRPQVMTAADRGELLTLELACRRGADVQDVVRELETWDAAAIWNVRSAGRLVASVRCRAKTDEPTCWQIGPVLVAPDVDNQGLFEALVAFAESVAPQEMTFFEFFADGGSAIGAAQSERLRRAKYRPVAASDTLVGDQVFRKRRRSR